MFAIILAAFLADATPPAPTAAPSAGPLREIVYKYSLDRKSEYTSGSYDSPAQSNTQNAGYSGTMTIDVVQVDAAAGILKVAVQDRTNALNDRGGTNGTLVIRADGTVLAVDGKYDQDMTTILPYLATGYFAGHDLQQGAQWVTYSTEDGIDYETTTTVSAVAGNDATVTTETKAQKGIVNGSFDILTKLVYEATKLVPISLDVQVRRNGSGDTAAADQSTHYHFDRVSDTLDKPAGQ